MPCEGFAIHAQQAGIVIAKESEFCAEGTKITGSAYSILVLMHRARDVIKMLAHNPANGKRQPAIGLH